MFLQWSALQFVLFQFVLLLFVLSPFQQLFVLALLLWSKSLFDCCRTHLVVGAERISQ